MTDTTNTQTTSRFLQATVLALLTLVIALGATLGILLAERHTTTPAANTTASTSVSDYNDGYASAKQDDCQQGDQQACTWLKNN